ncbi:winged helix-turn-helix transcriptional regulator [Roseateles sp. BYS78W]|uniref:Winged helix-turn-helix transcriptional regulator n=1 Tax=Pelomonas candidula TaxID=3299025 RepID=A0ABW7HAU9_9BURK
MSPSHIDRSEIPKPSEPACEATREILDRIADKWSLYIIATLRSGTRRFNELRREVEGISQRMLTLTLRGLERDGLVTRTIFPTIPPRVDYELTELGGTLLEPVMALVAWAEKNKPAIAEAQKRFDKAPEPLQASGLGTVHRQL